MATWWPRFTLQAQLEGLLAPGDEPTLYQLQGGAPTSAGTHTGGGVGDADLFSAGLRRLARNMGADASWGRMPWQGPWAAHEHFVLRGCPHNSPARYQITAVDAGYNGLGLGGRGGSDDGPRPLSGRTWLQGITWADDKNKKAGISMARHATGTPEYRSNTKGFDLPKKKAVVPVIENKDGTVSFAWTPGWYDIRVNALLVGLKPGKAIHARIIKVQGNSNTPIGGTIAVERFGSSGDTGIDLDGMVHIKQGERLRLQLTAYQRNVKVVTLRSTTRKVG